MPSGAPVGAGLTVAVNVTLCPDAAGFGLAVSAVVVTLRFTTSSTGADVEVANVEFPEYTAVIECDPVPSVDVVKVATPEAFTVPVPISVVPS